MSLTFKEHVALAPLTTFEIGGEADFYAEVKTEADLREGVQFAKQKNLPHIVLAGGSNVLIPDEGLRAVVLHLRDGEHTLENGRLTADAGCNLLEIIRVCAKSGYGGWEKLAGIPGTIGGAIRGNAGAFGSEIKDFVITVRAYNSQTGETKNFVRDVCDFSYRHSVFKDNPEWVITRVSLDLLPVDPVQSLNATDETIAERERRHLQNVRAAGSFFMNPRAPQSIVDLFEKEKGVQSRHSRVPAGWLIEKAGMKGAHVGEAVASEQHPNYIVNRGSARASDVKALAEKIKSEVRARFAVELEEEAAIL